MRVYNDRRGYHDQRRNDLNKFIVGDGYIEFDPKSETDAKLSYEIWRRAQYCRVVDNNGGAVPNTPCSTCGFPMIVVRSIFGRIIYECFDVCPVCGKEAKLL